MIITSNLSAPNIQDLFLIGRGEDGEIYTDGHTAYKVIYTQYSDTVYADQLIHSSKIQNSLGDYAPTVYSVGLRKDGRIWVEMQFLDGFKPVHDQSVSKDKIKALIGILKQADVHHGDISSSNILTDGQKVVLIDFDTARKINLGKDDSMINRVANMFGV